MFGAGGLALSLLVVGTSLSRAAETNCKPTTVATVFKFMYETAFATGWLGVP